MEIHCMEMHCNFLEKTFYWN